MPLAQLNIARMLEPLESPRMKDFVDGLDHINALAEAAPGFVWRLKSDDGRSATYAAHAFDPDVIVNYTIWENLEALKHFTYQSGHGSYFRRRLEWFEPLGKPTTAMWWVPAGEVPSVEEAKRRYDHLVEHGPSAFAFGFRDEIAPPGEGSG